MVAILKIVTQCVAYPIRFLFEIIISTQFSFFYQIFRVIMATQFPNNVGRFKVYAKDYLTKKICEELCTYLEYLPRVREEISESNSPGSTFLNHFEEKEGGIHSTSISKLIKILRERKCVATAAAISDGAAFLGKCKLYHVPKIKLALTSFEVPTNISQYVSIFS